MRVLVSVTLSLLLAGCATVPDTPRQAKARTDFENCKQSGNLDVVLNYVAPNGQFKWQTTGGSNWMDTQKRLMDCMRGKGWKFYTGGPVPN